MGRRAWYDETDPRNHVYRCETCGQRTARYRECRACGGDGFNPRKSGSAWDAELPDDCQSCDGMGGRLVCAPCQQAERVRQRAMTPTLPGMEGLVRR